MILLFWYIVITFILGSASTFYQLSKQRDKDSILGGYIGHTFRVVVYAIFLFMVYPLIKQAYGG